MSDAKAARTTLCTAKASGTDGARRPNALGGGALMFRHSAQSSMWLLVATSPWSLVTSSLAMPDVEHNTSIDCGLIMGEAMATPMASANHSSTQRARRVMGRIWAVVGMGLVWHRAGRLTKG